MTEWKPELLPPPVTSIPWPALNREIIGALVEVMRELRTKGGTVFERGTRMVVVHAHGRWLDLSAGVGDRFIGRVDRRSVRLIALSGGKPPRKRR